MEGLLIFCNQCGSLVADSARFCSGCDAANPLISAPDSSVSHQAMNFTPTPAPDLNIGRIIEPQLSAQAQPSPKPVMSGSAQARSPLFIAGITVGVTVCVLALSFMALRAWLNDDKGSNKRNTESQAFPAIPTATTQAAGSPPADQYVTYSNSDFNFSIEYPVNILFPVSGSESATGQSFSSRDEQAKLQVVGIFNRPGETAEESYNAILADYSRKGRVITYKVLRQNWHVISGFDGDRVFYEKTIFNSGMIKLFRFEWPESQRSIYEQITTHISKSFTG